MDKKLSPSEVPPESEPMAIRKTEEPHVLSVMELNNLADQVLDDETSEVTDNGGSNNMFFEFVNMAPLDTRDQMRKDPIIAKCLEPENDPFWAATGMTVYDEGVLFGNNDEYED